MTVLYDPKDMTKEDIAHNSKFKDLDLDSVRKLAEYGHSDLFMADFFEVNDKTWYRWKIKYPKFAQALEAWRAKASKRVEKALYEKAVGYQHREEKIHWDKEGYKSVHVTVKQHPPSEAAAMAWLKNRDPDNWKDKQVHEHEVNDLAAMISRGRKRAKAAKVEEELDGEEDFLK